ncbi:outer membrane porin GjpA [Mycobacterium shimoidei]|uniref:outer membrane porin GjpA n=1 Tax=Mycobacterium shimoidei TaxID=29313 RepID=UPI0008489AA8|nr:outer membrane porin GjpA [Mycobacterium shimoidei]MCV7258219.1 outer membrane porin GjpA [Mycobacterium shimoidei]ODR08921.1 hypothetical protein BHQ16_20105 [Mycobacterium shimoidei]ORW82328.1 hypothetical protein AWC26_05195 [Mycobacterium shimoidei]
MELTTRPWITAGVALAGAGAIAAIPVAAPLAGPQSRVVQLATDVDPVTPFLDALTTASANATAVADFYFEAPEAALQQAIVNQVGFIGEDPATALQDFQINFLTALLAATFIDPDQDEADLDFIDGLTSQTLDAPHQVLQTALTEGIPGIFPAPDGQVPLLVDFLSSPLSGVLISSLSPVLSPLVEFGNSIQAAIDALGTDPTTALQDLINIPANVTNAFFNGTTLDLSALIPLIEQGNIVGLPDGASIDSLSLALGGLFSPGSVVDGAGGSILNALGLDLSGVPGLGNLDIVGQGVGPIAAMADLSRIVAEAIGWDGTGNPLDALAFPAISGDLLGGLFDTGPMDILASLF